jgi:lysozyme
MTPAQRAAVAGVAAVLAASGLAVPLIAKWEGVEERGYLDPVKIPTACVGHTATAVVGKIYSPRACMDLLARDTIDHGLKIDPCIKVPISTETRAALTSFAFNVGAQAFCTSTLARKLNAGDLRGACAELSKWVYAGGKKLPGLVRRREEERAYCERGLR